MNRNAVTIFVAVLVGAGLVGALDHVVVPATRATTTSPVKVTNLPLPVAVASIPPNAFSVFDKGNAGLFNPQLLPAGQHIAVTDVLVSNIDDKVAQPVELYITAASGGACTSTLTANGIVLYVAAGADVHLAFETQPYVIVGTTAQSCVLLRFSSNPQPGFYSYLFVGYTY